MLPTERDLNIIRGKVLAGVASRDEVLSVFGYIDHLQDKLDEADDNDYFGRDGWRDWFGLEE